jgi:parallel beta-helix repeat protein
MSGEFKKIAYFAPYGILSAFDDTTLGAASYFGQLDSCGINLVIGGADSITTDTSITRGILHWGQDSLMDMPYPGCPACQDLDLINLTSWAVNVEAEAENTSADYSDVGYHVEASCGTDYFEDVTPVGWMCRSGIDTAGRALYFNSGDDTARFTLNVRHLVYGYLNTRVRMKVWNTLSTDTLCKITTSYKSTNGQDTTNVRYVLPTEFFSGQWRDIVASTFSVTDTGHNCTVTVDWYGQDSMAVDQVYIANAKGYTMHILPQYEIDTAISDFYNRIIPAGHYAFYGQDEPMPNHYYAQSRFDISASRTGPEHRNVMTSRHAYWLQRADWDPPIYLADFYEIRPLYDSSSSGFYSIQKAYQNYVDRIAPRAYEVIDTLEREFWMASQTGAQHGLDSVGECVTGVRCPTTQEMTMLSNLAVCYGASGYAYFVYSTLYFHDSVYYDEVFDMEIHRALPETAVLSGCTDNVRMQGLVDWDTATDRYEPNERWYAARDWNAFIDSLWMTLEDLEWQGADEWNELGNINGCIIDSIYSAAALHEDSIYLQVGRFTSLGGDEYYMLVNRRTLSSDSQDVVIECRDTYGALICHDVYDGTVDTTYDSCGTVRHLVQFEPGQLRLFRVEHLADFAGTWKGTWPQYSTINVVGDVTVDSNNSLSIETSNVSIAPYSDSESGGADADKVEFRVSGELRLEGSSDNRIELFPDTTADSSWYGVTILSGGRAYVNNAYIKNAWCGLWLEGTETDTVINSRFENTWLYGMYTKSDDAHFSQDTFALTGSSTHAGYGVYAAWADVDAKLDNCFFENIGHPIRLYNSDMTVSDCYFVEYDYHQNGSGGYPAIAVGFSSNPTIEDCTFNNFTEGVYVESGCNTVVDGCEFRSDSTRSDDPFMYIGILGTPPTTSSCTVRNSCFKPCDHAHIQTDSTVFDLGISPDSVGLNTFHVELVYDVRCWSDNRPTYAVNNNSGSSIEAEGNWWDADANVGWISGTVDITPVGATAGCGWYTAECGGGAKVSGDSAVEISTDEILPLDFAVRQNYPNPFNPVTVIGFDIPDLMYVNLEVYNVLGQQVVTLVNRTMEPGVYNIEWDGRDGAGSPVSSGIYLYRLTAGEFVRSRKMMLIK